MTITSTIAEQVTDYHRASAGQLPAEVADAFTAEQRALAAAGEPSGVASRAPGFQMANCSTSPASRPRSPKPWPEGPP